MTRVARCHYTDVLGRTWPRDKLDLILADATVMGTVMTGVGLSLSPNGTWSPGKVLSWARLRYQREPAAALMLLLITRYFDTIGAHLLGRRRVP